MTISEYPGTLLANNWAGSQPASYDASKLTSGSLAVARTPTPSFGTKVTGSMDTLYAPPTKPSFVAVTVTANPTLTNSSGAALRQARAGTISPFYEPLNGQVLEQPVHGWIHPSLGSWSVRNIGSANVTLNLWREWKMK